jgi:hypothetical protein
VSYIPLYDPYFDEAFQSEFSSEDVAKLTAKGAIGPDDSKESPWPKLRLLPFKRSERHPDCVGAESEDSPIVLYRMFE